MKNLNVTQLLEIDILQLEQLVVEDLSENEFEEMCDNIPSPDGPSIESVEALFEYIDIIYISKSLDAFVSAALYRAQPFIKQSVCIEFDYCGRQERGEFISDNNKIILSLVDILCVCLTQIPITSTVTLAVFIIRKKYLDKLCECKNNK